MNSPVATGVNYYGEKSRNKIVKEALEAQQNAAGNNVMDQEGLEERVRAIVATKVIDEVGVVNRNKEMKFADDVLRKTTKVAKKTLKNEKIQT
ncbi:hypothetical protein Tco_0740422 [Tanacetum coccineum]